MGPNRVWFVGRSARLLLYTPTASGSLGSQPGSYCIPQPRLVRWVVSQAPLIYPNRPWFAGWSAPYFQQVGRNMPVYIYIVRGCVIFVEESSPYLLQFGRNMTVIIYIYL